MQTLTQIAETIWPAMYANSLFLVMRKLSYRLFGIVNLGRNGAGWPNNYLIEACAITA